MLLFAQLAEAVGTRALDVAWPDRSAATVADLDARLRRDWPALAARTFRIAVNRSYAGPERPVDSGDEIALIPPVSGG